MIRDTSSPIFLVLLRNTTKDKSFAYKTKDNNFFLCFLWWPFLCAAIICYLLSVAAHTAFFKKKKKASKVVQSTYLFLVLRRRDTKLRIRVGFCMLSLYPLLRIGYGKKSQEDLLQRDKSCYLFFCMRKECPMLFVVLIFD